MKRSRLRWRRTAASVTLAAAIAVGLPGPALADPVDSDPNAAARDPDYAAGKRALDVKDWSEAAKRFGQAAQRDPDSTPISTTISVSPTGISGGSSPRSNTTSARSR